MPSTKSLPKISVIIATKNEEKNIANCLKSLLSQTFDERKIEIIVIDIGSKDDTVRIAKRYIKDVYDVSKSVNLKRVENKRGTQINFGVKKSHGEIIFFPDADMTFDRELIKEALRLISEKNFDALYVPEIVIGKGILGKIRNFERSFYNETCIDAVRFVRKNIFLKLKGFDEKNIKFGPDDWDFNKRLKKEAKYIGITSNKIYHHEENLGLLEYLRKKISYKDTYEGYIKKWGKDDPDIRKQFGFWYRYFGVFFENGKCKKIFRSPFLTFGMYSLRFTVGIQYLIRNIILK